MIEMKAFLYILLTNFTFVETGEKIIKANVCVPLRLMCLMLITLLIILRL
jgi:hypothetical protein